MSRSSPTTNLRPGFAGEIQAQMEKDGVTLPFYASQIAATAVSNGMVLVTHNTADFEPVVEKSYLRLEDWFTA